VSNFYILEKSPKIDKKIMAGLEILENKAKTKTRRASYKRTMPSNIILLEY